MALASSSNYAKEISSVCCEEIRSAVMEMEESQDPKKCARIWKNCSGSKTYELGALYQLALVYKYIVKKVPNGIFKLNQKLPSGNYNTSDLKKNYSSITGSVKIDTFLKELTADGVLLLLGQLIADSKFVVTKSVLIDFLTRINGVKEPQGVSARVFMMELEDSSDEDDRKETDSCAWQDEALVLFNTLAKVCKGKGTDPEATSLLEEIHSVNKSFRDLQATLGTDPRYDQTSVILGWMDSVLKLMGDARIVKVDGMKYYVLKNICDRMSALRSSI